MAEENKKVAELEAQLAKLKEENTILRDQKVSGKNDFTGKQVEGSLEVEMIDTKTNKSQKKKVEFVPGAVWCRTANGEKVWSEDLMALANGKELTKEAALKSPELISMDQKKAADWIATLARRGATFLRVVGSVVLLLILMLSSITVEAQQFRSGHLEYFTLDTLTNGGTITYLPSKSSTGFEEYDYSWQVINTNISGTSAGSIIVEESLFSSGDYWTPVDTVAIVSGTAQIASGTLGAVRQRIRVVGTGTQSTQVRVAALFRKREF
ncbi:hypothetical protein [Flavilitoribacter nigricans]|uniref:Uncharacterized protein n=1 Tax=Flavilitoribacter nigricans (strain ATCC 23147 / DSM 23189 / NBRC 102662 / NCIMB 1420 / SS-2) TaxID=1122177 RepID=A0A2D0NEL4_FLAN2|nr:hypothetical protein [Flavilitoribacter nigricans]PHN06954.1 hypothetical protein CRP01_09060 [Flavilitoribacter nigricans DSM 23189 = NBRC 102662]